MNRTHNHYCYPENIPPGTDGVAENIKITEKVGGETAGIRIFI